MKHIRLPLTEADIAALQAGDEVLLSGPLYTARRTPPISGCAAACRRESLCRWSWRGRPFTMWGPPRRSPVRSLAPPAPPPAIEWIPTRRRCWRWG